jgi:hypothetical protein
LQRTIDTGDNGQALQRNSDAIVEVKSSPLPIKPNTDGVTQRAAATNFAARSSTSNEINHGNANSREISETASENNVEGRDWVSTLGEPIGRPGGNKKLFFLLRASVFTQENRLRSEPLPRPHTARTGGRLLADA